MKIVHYNEGNFIVDAQILIYITDSLFVTIPAPGHFSSVENSERDGNTRPNDLPLEKSVCRSGSNS